ncbi:hypothetical protein ACHQM5_028294 [Ranunculus cassubicifolius]
MEILQKKLGALTDDSGTGTPVRYLPLDHVYSSTATCISASGSSNVMSKKIKACKRSDLPRDNHDDFVVTKKFVHVYSRRRRKLGLQQLSESESRTENNSGGFEVICNEIGGSNNNNNKKKRISSGNSELVNLGIHSSFGNGVDCNGSRGRRFRSTRKVFNQNSTNDCRVIATTTTTNKSSNADRQKKWIHLNHENVDENKFVGLQCRVYWPLDGEWYSGKVTSYDSESGRHHVNYDDGEEESLVFAKEKIKFFISREEMQRLDLKIKVTSKEDINVINEELFVLATIFDDCTDVEPGDIIWAKLTGHAMWPAVIVNESNVAARKSLKTNQGDKRFPVQFFGTHDFAWITIKQYTSFLKGLQSSYHVQCKTTSFRRSLEEAKLYLNEQKLPKKMLQLQSGIEVDDGESESGEDGEFSSSDDDFVGDKRTKKRPRISISCPFDVDDLRVISLGQIVTDSEFFQDERDIWPEGYTVERKFISATDPSVNSCYKMEVLRDPESKFRPLFKVTMDNNEQFKGPNPSACWNKIYRRIKKINGISCNVISIGDGLERIHNAGSYMFGFSDPKISKIIKDLSKSRKSSIYSGRKSASKRHQGLPTGYRHVGIDWKDLDKCNVCHMDEEYANNVFLQCDKCRMMVHSRCYGELEPVDGLLWLCNLCRPGAPEFPPPCCLCPVSGGAMKPTTDGQWAHLACAIWIPETCFLDIKKMEPIDGLSRISKDRWKLLCSICGVSYGACIQCSKSTCFTAYHPLCARAAGLCVELEDEDKLHLISFDEDEENQCIRLLSFCKKHKQPSKERSPSDEQLQPVLDCCSKYTPPSNPSGCARTEPYDYLGRRGQKQPEDVVAAPLKRFYVENRPYLITGYCQNKIIQRPYSSNDKMLSSFSASIERPNTSKLDTSKGVLSMAEKYSYMKETIRMRLAFGKSGIHRFGVFARNPHKAGDMVIEYIGELVRPSIADRREHFIYNSLVGAGTYMFRIDDERVIDATRAGSIAHLINHSCEPNCYSRVITIHGEEHIIIFAKRDITTSEELTYDYRFFSIGEQLACYCGFPRCRGVVNDVDSEEQVAKLWVPRSELIGWKED